MGGKIVRVAMVTLFDGDRGLSINRGTFVEAPQEFFEKYDPNDLAIPKARFDPKSDFKITLDSWVGMPEIVSKPEKSEVVTETQPVVSVTSAEIAPAPVEPAKAMTTSDIPTKAKAKKVR